MCSSRAALWVLAVASVSALAGADAFGKVFHARDEAMTLAFPGHERVETQSLFLTVEQRQRIERMGGELAITTHLGAGTTIQATVPM